jgi:hypothetical protein
VWLAQARPAVATLGSSRQPGRSTRIVGPTACSLGVSRGYPTHESESDFSFWGELWGSPITVAPDPRNSLTAAPEYAMPGNAEPQKRRALIRGLHARLHGWAAITLHVQKDRIFRSTVSG